MTPPKTESARFAFGLVAVLSVSYAGGGIRGIEVYGNEAYGNETGVCLLACWWLPIQAHTTHQAPMADGPEATRERLKAKQCQAVKAFRSASREFLTEYYDYHLGLNPEAPQHSVLKALLLELKEGVADTFSHSLLEKFVLGKIEQAHQLKNEAVLRKTVNDLAFFLKDLPDLDNEQFEGEPRMNTYVAEPWREMRPTEFVLACNTQALISALDADSTPNHASAGLEVYRQLSDASFLLIEETLPDNEGETKAKLIRIESAAEIDPHDGTIAKHPVLIFRVQKMFLDKYDGDERGQPRLKPFEFDLRQVTNSTRDQDGNLTEFVVTHELVEPVVVGGNRRLGQYGFHYYKTVLRASAIEGNDDSTLVQFSLLTVPDFRGRLASSRWRPAVGAFIYLENRKVMSRIVMRVKAHWPKRVR